MSELKLKKLNNRLDALETCLLTMTDLRLYLCKAESKYGLFRYLREDYNEYKEERRHIDTFLDYLFAQEEHHRKLRNEELEQLKKDKEMKKDKKNERKRKCLTCLF
jgi:hypothetical protein